MERVVRAMADLRLVSVVADQASPFLLGKLAPAPLSDRSELKASDRNALKIQHRMTKQRCSASDLPVAALPQNHLKNAVFPPAGQQRHVRRKCACAIKFNALPPSFER